MNRLQSFVIGPLPLAVSLVAQCYDVCVASFLVLGNAPVQLVYHLLMFRCG